MRVKSLTKETVLDVAEHIVMTQGLNHCTIRNLANELNVAVGTLYNYYPSRDQLLHDLFQMSWNNTLSRLTALSEDSDLSIRSAMKAGLKILHEDVVNRGGLGIEIEGNSYLRFFADIRNEIIESFISIQMKSGIPRSTDLCNRARRIYAIISDELIFDEKIDNRSIDSIIDLFLPASFYL